MLELKVYDGDNEVRLEFEHSLLSLSKWESNYKKPFLASTQKLPTEMIDYYCDMLVTPGVSRNVVYLLEPEQLQQLGEYVNEKRTASTVGKTMKKGVKEIVTSELIYYWLNALEIDFHPTETWHISRIMMLIEITNYKKQPPEKVNKAEMHAQWQAANAKRKAELGSNG